MAVQGKRIKVSIGGLKGGHSGMDIVNNRSNANKLLGRLLFDLRERNTYSVLHMEGGYKDNVIPREAFAELVLIQRIIQSFAKILMKL